jgi:hypothetical protein
MIIADELLESMQAGVRDIVTCLGQQKRFNSYDSVVQACNNLNLWTFAVALVPDVLDVFAEDLKAFDLIDRLESLFQRQREGRAGVSWGRHGQEDSDQRIAMALSTLPMGVSHMVLSVSSIGFCTSRSMRRTSSCDHLGLLSSHAQPR